LNRLQSSAIIDLIAGADGRETTEQIYAAWFIALQPFDYKLGIEAASLVIRDDKLNRNPQPKDVIAKIGELKEKQETDLNRARALEPAPPSKGVDQPLCRAHNQQIMFCKPCMDKAHQLSKVTGGIDSPEYHTEFYNLVAHRPT